MPGENDAENPMNGMEIFEGGDVSTGRELVEMLNSEEIGTPVYQVNWKNKKTAILADRKPAEDDVTIRQKTSFDERLIGLILPMDESTHEYIYLGIYEGGFVFKINGEFHKDYWDRKFSREINARYECSGTFREAVSDVAAKTSFTLLEHQNPQGFIKLVTETVASLREAQKSIRETRSQTRKNLFEKLYGKKT